MLQSFLKALEIFKGARDFFPIVRHLGRVTYLKLVELMSGANTTLSSTDVLAVTDLEARTVIRHVLRVERVPFSLQVPAS